MPLYSKSPLKLASDFCCLQGLLGSDVCFDLLHLLPSGENWKTGTLTWKASAMFNPRTQMSGLHLKAGDSCSFSRKSVSPATAVTYEKNNKELDNTRRSQATMMTQATACASGRYLVVGEVCLILGKMGMSKPSRLRGPFELGCPKRPLPLPSRFANHEQVKLGVCVEDTRARCSILCSVVVLLQRPCQESPMERERERV